MILVCQSHVCLPSLKFFHPNCYIPITENKYLISRHLPIPIFQLKNTFMHWKNVKKTLFKCLTKFFNLFLNKAA
jgi:hypothetical protein